MKTPAVIFLLTSAWFLTSCSSYKEIVLPKPDPVEWQEEVETMVIVGKHYKIVPLDGKPFYGKVTAIRDHEISGERETLYDEEDVSFTIPIEAIADIRQRRFSPLKTLAAVTIPFAALAIIVVANDPWL